MNLLYTVPNTLRLNFTYAAKNIVALKTEYSFHMISSLLLPVCLALLILRK